MERSFVLEVPNDLRVIERAVELVVARCHTCEAHARKFRFNVRVSLAEALANAMLYGNAGDPRKTVRVEVVLDGVCLEARVTDQGDGFDPDSVEDPTRPENLTRPGGRGLFLMRQLMDEVLYNDRGNSVTLRLRLDGSPPAFGEAASA